MAGTSLDRVVLDTSYILRIIFSEDYAFFVYLNYRYDVELFTCKQRIDELASALNYPRVRKLLKAKPEKLIGFFKKHSIEVKVEERFDRIPDIKDNYLVDLAYASKSYYIVSGDKQVLNLKHVGKIQIISALRFRQLLRQRHPLI